MIALLKITRTLICVVVEFALLASLIGCGIAPPPNIPPEEANVASLDPQNWYIYYSSGMPFHPSPDPSGAWSFDFPGAQYAGHVNYVQTPFNATKVLHNVTLTFRVESDAPQYQVIDPTDIPPATVHLFLEQQNDDLVNPDGRWWAHGDNDYNLGSQDNATITRVVPLTPDQWSNVIGLEDPQAFYSALSNVGWIGVTFGGQYFWGHGVALDGGTSRFVLVSLVVN